MVEDTNLTVPVLEALSNLALSPKLLGPATDMVLNQLPSCTLEALPAVVRFLLQVLPVSTSPLRSPRL